jgi:hypothetical protein
VTVKGHLGEERPSEEESEAREEAGDSMLVTDDIKSMYSRCLQESLATNSLGLLAPVGLGRGLLDGESLKGMRLHGSSDVSHVGEERELATASSASGSTDNDGRHVEVVEWLL